MTTKAGRGKKKGLGNFGPADPSVVEANRVSALLSRGPDAKKPPKLGTATTNKGRIEIYAAREKERLSRDQKMMDALGLDKFEGDSYDFLTLIYKSPAFPIPTRIGAAEVVIKYDRPSLQSVEVSGNKNNPLQIVNTIMGALNGTGRRLPSRLDEDDEQGQQDLSSSEVEAE
jgi:hypothetical protein